MRVRIEVGSAQRGRDVRSVAALLGLRRLSTAQRDELALCRAGIDRQHPHAHRARPRTNRPPANLGEHGRVIRLAQLRLLDWIEDDDRLPAATPFYSSLDLGPDRGTGAGGGGSHETPVGGRVHAITYYRDAAGIVTSALAALALAAPADHRESPSTDGPCHPRYACGDHESYVARFALPPYLEGDAHGGGGGPLLQL